MISGEGAGNAGTGPGERTVSAVPYFDPAWPEVSTWGQHMQEHFRVTSRGIVPYFDRRMQQVGTYL